MAGTVSVAGGGKSATAGTVSAAAEAESPPAVAESANGTPNESSGVVALSPSRATGAGAAGRGAGKTVAWGLPPLTRIRSRVRNSVAR